MKINLKSALWTIVYSIGFVVLLIIVGNIKEHFQDVFGQTYRMFPYAYYAILAYFPLGLYLGLPRFVAEWKKGGSWKVNFYKIIFIVLPMIYISFYLFLPTSYPITNILIKSHSTLMLGMIVAGYFLMDAFKKQ